MPKQTFFHLQQDKQQSLVQAAFSEFSRASLHEASIANIIKDAGIPRGSFYQYFEDKEDLYFYILNLMSQKNFDYFISVLKEKDGDIFETFILSFQFLIKKHRNEEYRKFFKNAYLNMNYKLENTIANNMYAENKKEHFVNLIKLVNKSNLNIQDNEELHHLIKVIKAIMIQNIVQTFAQDWSDEEALQNYSVQLALIRRGIQITTSNSKTKEQ